MVVEEGDCLENHPKSTKIMREVPCPQIVVSWAFDVPTMFFEEATDIVGQRDAWWERGGGLKGGEGREGRG